jgi:hypothetical protein
MSAMPVQRIGDLQLDQDMSFQRRQWRVQRGAWLVGCLIVLLALTGLSGGGPLANASVSDTTDALSVDYDRIDRRHSPSTISLDIIPAGTQPTLQLWIGQDFLAGTSIESIQPEPVQSMAGSDRLILEFALDSPGEPVSIEVSVRPKQTGLREGSMGIVDGPEVEFRQLVLP